MADEDEDQKTEEPSSKRLEEARGRGELLVSREVTAWFLFVGTLLTIVLVVPSLADALARSLTVFIERPHTIRIDGQDLPFLLFEVFKVVGAPLAMAFVILIIAAVIGHVSQTGLFFSFELLSFKWERLSPIGGLKRLASIDAIIELGKGIVKMLIVGLVVTSAMMPILKDTSKLDGLGALPASEEIYRIIVKLLFSVLIILTGIAGADYLYQRFEYFKRLRMTKQEVKDEYKQSEGDPIIKGRLRQIRMDKARRRMMANVPKADVIITNPTHFAVALQYDSEKMAAPKLMAKGADLIAKKIREIAKENDIPIVENPPLARALYDTVELEQEIPTQHYRAVAEIISYVYKIKKNKR